jgi:hypothetical protein
VIHPFPPISLSLSPSPVGWFPFPPWGACITAMFGWPPTSYPPEQSQNLKEDKVRLAKGSLPRDTPCALRRRFRERCNLAAILDLLPQNHPLEVFRVDKCSAGIESTGAPQNSISVAPPRDAEIGRPRTVGTHGRSAFSPLRLRSPSKSVLRYASCSVLMTRIQNEKTV